MFINSISSKNNEKSYFKGAIFNTCASVESNILLNKAITDIGGFVIPQAIMSNNKDEAKERVFKSMLYFVFTFVSPFLLLPLINKHFLKKNKIIENLGNEQKRILEVSKKYLTKDGNYLKKGIKETAVKLFDDENKFDQIISKYDDLEVLRKSLIDVHTKIHAADLLTTNLMVASIPWLGNAYTKYRTRRSGYSGAYKLADENFTEQAAMKHDKSKKLRQVATFFSAILPALLLPSLIRNGMLGNSQNKILKWFNKNANKFDYKSGIYMSRLTALAMWISSDYIPYQLASRDKYEYRDCLIRGTSIGFVFWGGDLFLKKFLSNYSYKIFKTKLINQDTKEPYRLSDLKHKLIESGVMDEKILRKTRNLGVVFYLLNLLLVSATLGFGLPIFLNKFLKNSIDKDLNDSTYDFSFINKSEVFKDFYTKKGKNIL